MGARWSKASRGKDAERWRRNAGSRSTGWLSGQRQHPGPCPGGTPTSRRLRLPSRVWRLTFIALRSLGLPRLSGGPLVPDQQVQIEYAPGRVRVYLEGYGSVESET